MTFSDSLFETYNDILGAVNNYADTNSPAYRKETVAALAQLAWIMHKCAWIESISGPCKPLEFFIEQAEKDFDFAVRIARRH